MSQPFPAQPSAPKPGPPATPSVSQAPAIDPGQIGRDVSEFTTQVDDLRRGAQDRHDAGDDIAAGGGVDLSTLDAQAELLERAHDVLTATLEQLDRV